MNRHVVFDCERVRYPYNDLYKELITATSQKLCVLERVSIPGAVSDNENTGCIKKREQLISWANRFSWDVAAKKYWELYRDIE